MTHFTTFDLGLDGLSSQRDLAALDDPWQGPVDLPTARRSEVLPAVPELAPWAEALEIPGLDSQHLNH